ncbi:metallophosphoesterase [Roseovarius sp.]|uniref:metallophosphoesterase n=1 Tax=Roseovarius sp. TaxID=1486281 RepID=UPI0035684E76
MSLLKRLFGRSAPAGFDAPLAPDTPFYAIGDVHGCKAQMDQLLNLIAAEKNQGTIVFVGDYVDRGEQSAQVLRALYERRDDPQLTCLVGNHEDMMLQFIDAPIRSGPRWLRNGGLQTLVSFGVSGVSAQPDEETLTRAGEDLKSAIGSGMLDWLRALPTRWQSGNIAVVHAGADPTEPMALQTDEVLKWGHSDFATQPRSDNTWVLHGHTIVEAPTVRDGRIAIDTGAYATGRLTAAYVSEEDVTFLST